MKKSAPPKVTRPNKTGSPRLRRPADSSGRTIDRLRRICDELPECVVAGDQHHKLSVRGRTLGYHTVDHHGDGRIALTLKAIPGENHVLVASDPLKFFLPPYMAHHGYIGIYLDTERVDWAEIREFIIDAYRLAAPKKLADLLG